jgi:hypothetical protein
MAKWMSVADRRRLEAARIIAAMAGGVSLSIQFTKTGSRWQLSNGERVESAIALAVVNDVRIVGEGGLLDGASQIWRYSPTTEEQMPLISQLYSSGSGGFINADRLRDGDVTVTIAAVSFNEMVRDKQVNIVGFEEQDWRLILGPVVAQQIARLHGDDTDHWIGKQITLYCDPTIRYQGQVVGGIRVRGATGNGQMKPTQHPPIDDSIPFN